MNVSSKGRYTPDISERETAMGWYLYVPTHYQAFSLIHHSYSWDTYKNNEDAWKAPCILCTWRHPHSMYGKILLGNSIMWRAWVVNNNKIWVEEADVTDSLLCTINTEVLKTLDMMRAWGLNGFDVVLCYEMCDVDVLNPSLCRYWSRWAKEKM